MYAFDIRLCLQGQLEAICEVHPVHDTLRVETQDLHVSVPYGRNLKMQSSNNQTETSEKSVSLLTRLGTKNRQLSCRRV